MADAIEVAGGPPAVDQTGNLTVWAIPANGVANLDAVKLTELGATGAKRITYSFTPDGWNPNITQEKQDDDRLTSPQRRQGFGRTLPEVPDLVYVDSTAVTSAAEILKDGGDWVFVERRNVPQTELAKAADKVRAYKLGLGLQVPGPIGSGKFTKRQPVVVEYVSKEHALA